ncbi:MULTISPECIES: LacI family DNA-binding transcriptional regulator [unclassified Paenibacillus]|uniref:LacI family DNA-binding transcriptional regulator n=1 Tax=unclassified Paenibacillus TaxID=185978 RepID=UPI001AE9EF06|nr:MULTISPECIES: LacI family DNA-binding transcriptional regulator [unclassified Paenibacillus]MBP1153734.1 LacI family sucrose operon transcriptional repressor [Paenibacillus sp. PvP091]MBP1170881.1 LacI family sucrose operon transcriptional repressor [Paenibacillus sp. PvR098]MBP2441909.1 LacI family sucrose operon transcriptional repressor [Paenibacillus sp. PvP052]
MATIHDVAKKAGVSVTTVSRVLNNRGYISEATRSKVYQTMDELGYQPNEIARSLLRKQSNLIGLIIPDVSHPFFSELANHVEYHAYQNGFKVLLCNSHLDPVKEKDYIEMLRRNRVDGIIMGSHTLEVQEYMNLHSPLVTIDRQIGEKIPYISSDNYRGGELATELLIRKGCRKIAHICGNLELDLLANRRSEAFKHIVSKHAVKHLTIQTDMNVFDQWQYERIIHSLFQEHPDIDGVFASSDIIAAFAVKECERAGKHVPGDVRIVGYDDVKAASWLTPAITTVRQPIGEIGRLAVELIRKQMDDEPLVRENVLAVELVERATT